jgi:hypothetical protein
MIEECTRPCQNIRSCNNTNDDETQWRLFLSSAHQGFFFIFMQLSVPVLYLLYTTPPIWLPSPLIWPSESFWFPPAAVPLADPTWSWSWVMPLFLSAQPWWSSWSWCATRCFPFLKLIKQF